MNRAVFGPHGFVCTSGGECQESCRADNDYWEGQLSHVGRHYDMVRHGRPFRVVVIGKDVGRGPAHIALDQRYASVHDDRSAQPFWDRNPHIRGVTIALRCAFEMIWDFSDREAEVISTAGGDSFHIFDAYALVNTLLCTSTVPGTTTSDPSPAMRRNCQRHLAATLKTLEPTLMIVQGVNLLAQRPLGPLVEERRELGSHLLEAWVAGQRTVVCAFSHPYQVGHQHLAWHDPEHQYVTEVIRPTVRAALGVV